MDVNRQLLSAGMCLLPEYHLKGPMKSKRKVRSVENEFKLKVRSVPNMEELYRNGFGCEVLNSCEKKLREKTKQEFFTQSGGLLYVRSAVLFCLYRSLTVLVSSVTEHSEGAIQQH